MSRENQNTKKSWQAPASRVIQRFLWDRQAKAAIHEFTVGYLDRFVGLVEKSFSQFDFTVDIASVDIKDVFIIPEHRIQYFKLQGKIVWDKREGKRVDNVFGSMGGSTLDETLRALGYPPPTFDNDENEPADIMPDDQDINTDIAHSEAQSVGALELPAMSNLLEEVLQTHLGGPQAITLTLHQRATALDDLNQLITSFCTHNNVGQLGMWLTGSCGLATSLAHTSLLGPHTDLDVQFVGHTFCTPQLFFESLHTFLVSTHNFGGNWSNQSRVVLEARIPRMVLVHSSTNMYIDLCYSFVDRTQTTPAWLFNSQIPFQHLESYAELLEQVRRVPVEALHHLFQLRNFFELVAPTAVREVYPSVLWFVKAWAKARAIDSGRLGYVPGIAWVVMVGVACLDYHNSNKHNKDVDPEITAHNNDDNDGDNNNNNNNTDNSYNDIHHEAILVLRHFFNMFALWDWDHCAVDLFAPGGVKQISPGFHPSSSLHSPNSKFFVICPPSHPFVPNQNACFHASHSTRQVIVAEMKRAQAILSATTSESTLRDEEFVSLFVQQLASQLVVPHTIKSFAKMMMTHHQEQQQQQQQHIQKTNSTITNDVNDFCKSQMICIRVKSPTNAIHCEAMARVEARFPLIARRLLDQKVVCSPFGTGVAREEGGVLCECCYCVIVHCPTKEQLTQVLSVTNFMQQSCHGAIAQLGATVTVAVKEL